MDNSYNAPIGIFDSGVGGISVLCTAVKSMPNEDFIYYADNAHAPYGIQTVEQVKNHSFRIVNYLIGKGVKAIVVACNTATSAAIQELRSSFSIPIIGMEPALKPAIENHNSKKIVVLATPMTLKNQKFKDLMVKYGNKESIISLPAPKLVELIESGDYSSPTLNRYISDIFSPYHGFISSIVLGCTHFLYAAQAIQNYVGNDVVLVDGNRGTVKHLYHVLESDNLLNKTGGVVDIYSSGNEKTLTLCKDLFSYGKKNLKFY